MRGTQEVKMNEEESIKLGIEILEARLREIEIRKGVKAW